MKFKFNYLTNQLWKEEREILTNFTNNFQQIGFVLDNGWITFAIQHTKIRTFIKTYQPNQITYYRKDLPKQEINEWEFTKQDQIIKDANGRWQTIEWKAVF